MDPYPPPIETDSSNIIIMLLAAIIVIIPFWRIFAKAGYSSWLSLLMVIPVVNIILLYFLAFAHWPVLKEKDIQKTDCNYPRT